MNNTNVDKGYEPFFLWQKLTNLLIIVSQGLDFTELRLTFLSKTERIRSLQIRNLG